MSDRWIATKFGLFDFWYYDEEEFELSNGKIIFRGTNGSGKSVTTQSFIPLLLDGDKSNLLKTLFFLTVPKSLLIPENSSLNKSS